MDAKLRELAPDGIRQKIQLLKEDLFELRRKKRFRQLENTAIPHREKAKMARLLTLLREDELKIRSLGTEKFVAEKIKPAESKEKTESKPAAKIPAPEFGRRKGPGDARTTKSAIPKPGSKRRGIFERLGLRKKSPSS